MPRKYDTKLLDAMKHGQYETEYENVKFLVKPIPEGGPDGAMDPRVYKSMRLMPLLMHFMPKPKKNASTLDKIMPYRKMFGEYKGDYIADEGVETQNITVSSSDGYQVPVRIYKRTEAGTDLPMFVYYHGGGFFGGGLHIVEQMCKLLVQNIDCVALSVDYRLCPEAHYPQPLDDCWAATRWAYEHAADLGAAPGRKIAVGGDSAGGNLAAAISLRDRDEGTNMVGLQVLIYPAVNIAGKETEFYHGTDPSKYHKSKKHRRVIQAVFNLMGSMMGSDGNMLDDVYLQGHEKPEHIYASPILDDFHDLPSTLLMFGEHDFLVFENFAYARHLTKVGADLKTVIYRGLGHGFADQIGVQPQAEDLIREVAIRMEEIL